MKKLQSTLTIGFAAFGAVMSSTPGNAETTHPHQHARTGAQVPGPVQQKTHVAPARRHTAPASVPEQLSVVGHTSPFGQHAMQRVGTATLHINAEELAQHQVVDVKGLMNLVPNLTVQPQAGNANVNFTLRGVGLKDFTSNNTPSVMTYVDDVALPIGFMAGSAMYDIAGVDVTPGPVGFTHGITDSAGEINVKTGDPTSRLHYGASEDLATYERSITNLYVSGPIARRLQFRVAAFTQQGGGYQKNMFTGQHLGSADKGGVRAKLAWQPDDRTEIMISGHFEKDNSEAPGVFNIVDNNVHHFPASTNNLLTSWGFRPQFTNLIGAKAGSKPGYDDTFFGANISASRDLKFAKITAISSYNQMYIHNLMDLDGTPYAYNDTYLNTNGSSFTQELRLHSDNERSRIQWVAGMFYNRTQLTSSFTDDFYDSVVRPYISRTGYTQKQQAFSQFGHMRLRLLNNLHLTAGVTHEEDDRHLYDMRTIHYGYSDVSFPTHGALANQFTGMGGIEYQALPNLLLYGSVKKGFKPGGFTANNTNVAQQLTPTKPESLLAYEVGFKSDFFHQHLRVNGNAFWYDYHNQQILGLDVVSGYGVVGQFINVPKSQIWGVELNVDAEPIPGLMLHQHVGYERGVYKNLNMVNSASVVANYVKTGVYTSIYNNYSGVDSGIPKLNLEGAASYRIVLSRNWHLTPYMNYSYRGSQLDVPGNQIYRMAPYFLMDMGLTFGPKSKRWSLTAYANNILGRHYDLTRDIGLNAFFGVPGTPRMVGGRFRIDL